MSECETKPETFSPDASNNNDAHSYLINSNKGDLEDIVSEME